MVFQARLTPALFAELVRLPAVLSVPGDALVGSAAAGSARGSLLVPSSALLYLGGMALNDYADRLRDSLERPGRPIPSGRVPARQARRTGLGLLAGGLALACVAGGPRTLRVGAPLAMAIWTYDHGVRQGSVGPVLMGVCRGLDVLLGASTGALLPALAPAAVIAAHTANVTALSQHEVDGASPAVADAVQRRTWAVAAAPPLWALLRRDPGSAAAAVAGSAAYLLQCRTPKDAANRHQSGAQTRRAVGAHLVGVVPLQAALLASGGAPRRAAAVLATLLLARRAARRRAVT